MSPEFRLAHDCAVVRPSLLILSSTLLSKASVQPTSIPFAVGHWILQWDWQRDQSPRSCHGMLQVVGPHVCHPLYSGDKTWPWISQSCWSQSLLPACGSWGFLDGRQLRATGSHQVVRLSTLASQISCSAPSGHCLGLQAQRIGSPPPSLRL